MADSRQVAIALKRGYPGPVSEAGDMGQLADRVYRGGKGLVDLAGSGVDYLRSHTPQQAWEGATSFVQENTPSLQDILRADAEFNARGKRDGKMRTLGKTLVGLVDPTPAIQGFEKSYRNARDNPDSRNASLAAGGGALMLGASLIPGPAKAAGKKGLKKGAEEVAEAIVRTPEQAAVIAKFGQKHTRDAALATKTVKQNKVAEAMVAPKTGTKRGPAGKVEPRKYRIMQDEQGQEAVLAAANRGEHLRPDGKGGYIGAPRTITSPQALGSMRGRMDREFVDSVEAIRAADPERLGTWYERAKGYQAATNEPYQLGQALDSHGVYSAGVSPEAELTFALKHNNSRILGGREMAYRGDGMRTLDDAHFRNPTIGDNGGPPMDGGFEIYRPGDPGNYSNPQLADKVGEYRIKNDPTAASDGLFGVNDFRAAQDFGYTKPDGSTWKAAVSGTMHPVMDAETALRVERANAMGAGGRSDWGGDHLQETPWVYGKAQDLHSRGINGRFAGDEWDGIQAALREANNTGEDYLYKHAGSATWETAPGASTGHVPSVLEMSPEARADYHNVGRWDVQQPHSLPDNPEVGAGPRDALYSGMQFRQLPAVESAGAYRNSAGVLESNPMTISRPLLDFPTGGGGGRISEPTRDAVAAAEQFRAVIDAQEAGAANLPNTGGSVSGKNAMVFDTRPPGETVTGVQPTAEQLAAMAERLEGTGYGATATNRGALVFPFDESATPRDLAQMMKGRDLQSIMPDARAMKGVASTVYVPGIGKWGEDGIVPTAPFSGEATTGLLDSLARLDTTVTSNLSESPDVRQIIGQKISRDDMIPGAREDIQNTRKFFRDADWERALDMIRKGVPAATALGALGYAAESMAGEQQR